MYLSILIVCGREEEADGGMVPRLLIYLFIYFRNRIFGRWDKTVKKKKKKNLQNGTLVQGT